MDLKIKLKCKKIYKLGSPVEVEISVRNLTKKTQYILKRDSPFTGLDNDCFLIKRGEEDMEYDSIRAKMGPVSSRDFMPVLPKQMISMKVKLSQRYIIKKSGQYTLQLKSGIYYTKYPEEFARYMKCQEVREKRTFYVLGKKGPYQTLGMMQQQEMDRSLGTNMLLGENNGHVFDPSVDDLHKTIILCSHYEVTANLEAVKKELETGVPHEENLHFQMVFGKYESDRYEKVSNGFEAVRTKLDTETITYKYNNKLDNCYAYVIGKTPAIYLCPLFLKAPFSGKDSKIGTILHELTHLYANTKDVELSAGVTCYGRENCRELAKANPALAIENADSYEFYFETIYSSFQDEVSFDASGYLETTGCGGPSVLFHPVSTAHELFYLGTGGTLRSAVYQNDVLSQEKELLDIEDKPLEAGSHPEVILFHDKRWLFYQKAASDDLYYSILDKGGKWSKEQTVCYKETSGSVEITHSIAPISPPQPIIHNGRLKLIYGGRKDNAIHMTMREDGKDEWSKEETIPNSTCSTKEVSCNPTPFCYRNKLYIVYADRNRKNIMEFATYDDERNLWNITKDIPRIRSCLITADSAMRAFATQKDVMILYSQSNTDNRVLHMNYEENTKKELWTDAENITDNSADTYLPQIDSLCSISQNETYFYLFYWNNKLKKLCVSRKINCF